ncbi:MAG: hypothetical protein ACRC7O_00930, partial [Fimbriiglobus sp.]
EFYLRWIQRLNAVAFATAAGRWVTRYAALPFGGALMTVVFTKYLIHEAATIAGAFRTEAPEFPENSPAEAATDVPIPPPADHGAALGPESLTAVVVLGVVYLGLLYSARFRAAVVAGLTAVWHGVRFAVADLPLTVWRSAPVRAVRRHPLTRFVTRYLGGGLAAGVLTAVVMLTLGFGPPAVVRTAGLMFALVSLAVNTYAGRLVEDRVAEWRADVWRAIRVNLLPGIYGWVVWGFRALAGAVERGLYAVDEWLRFREGQSEGSLVAKAVLAAVWFPIAYLVRFAFYLLLEPQINPVKHFPVVTVSHKLLLPLIPTLAPDMAHFAGVGENEAAGLLTLFIGCIPGVFGFIAWELKENWRLYAANRPAGRPPVPLGHHGETMRGLLRPGFHSGTVPKRFRWLRAAARDAEATGRPGDAARYAHEIEEMAGAIAATAERELVPLLT